VVVSLLAFWALAHFWLVGADVNNLHAV